MHIICDCHGTIYRDFPMSGRCPRPIIHSAYHDGVPYCMNRVGRDAADPVCFAHEKKGVVAGDAVLYVLGEPDVRMHIWRQINQKGRTEEAVITDLATSFLDAIAHEAKTHGTLTLVRFVVPPRAFSRFPVAAAVLYAHMATEGWFVPVGTLEDRVRYTKSLNSALAAGCAKRGLEFLPPIDEFAQDSGELKDEYMDDQTHLSPSCVPVLFEQLAAALAKVYS